jgi:hypothetical protein
MKNTSKYLAYVSLVSALACGGYSLYKLVSTDRFQRIGAIEESKDANRKAEGAILGGLALTVLSSKLAKRDEVILRAAD